MEHNKSGGKFTSSLGFVLAALGSAVGMGNIWLFPYRVGQYGGGAFLIPYFIFVALFSYVGLSGEFALGRLTGTGAMGSLDYVMKSRGKKGGKILGIIPLLGVLGIAIGYSVVVGWVLFYFTDFGQLREFCSILFGFAGHPLWDVGLELVLLNHIFWLAAAVACCMPLLPALKRWYYGRFGTGSALVWQTAASLVCLALSTALLAGQGYNPFLYYRF